LTVNNTGTLIQGYDQAVTLTNRITLNGDSTIGGAYNLTFTGTLTQSNGDRTLAMNNTGLTTFSNINLSADNTAHTLTMDVANGSTSVVNGVIANGGTGAGGLTKNGEGTLLLNGAATYTGSTILNAGTLLLGASDRLPDTSNLYLNGGTLSLNGYSDRVGTLNYGNATLDFGSGAGANYFMFADDGAVSGTLVLQNWTTVDRFAFNANNSVSTTFLDNLYFAGIGAGGQISSVNQNLTGYSNQWNIITPVTHIANVWDGGENNNNWSSKKNWNDRNTLPLNSDTTTVIFGQNGVSGVNLNPILDINFTVNSLIFSNVAGAYNITNSGGATLTFAGIVPNIIQKSPNNQTISAPLSLSTTLIADTYGAGSLTLSGNISGAGGIDKVSTGGPLILSGSNSYTGTTLIQEGVVNIRNNNALGGTGAGTEVRDGAALEVQNNISVGAEALTLAGMGINNGGALRNISGNNSMAGAITLAQDARINSDSGTLTLSGNISGSGSDLFVGGAGNVTLNGVLGTGAGALLKDGAGTLTLGGTTANTFTGGLTLNSGTVVLNKTANSNAINGPVTLGDGVGGTGADILRLASDNQINNAVVINIASSGLFDLNGHNETIAGINAVSPNAQIALGTGTLTVDAFENSAFAGVISGAGSLVKSGDNTLTLSGPNTYTGPTVINGGVLSIRNSTALGGSANGTTVAGGATLQIEGGISVSSEPLTLNGTGVSGTGALRNMLGNNTWTGPVTLASDAKIASDLGTLTLNGTVSGSTYGLTVDGAGNTTIGGVVSGSGTFTKIGTGTLTLSGANTYTGPTTISAGVVNIQNNTALGTSANGTTVAGGSTLQIQNNITVGEALTLNGTGTSGNGALQNVLGNNTWTGPVTLGSDAKIQSDSGTLALNGTVSGSTHGITVAGAGNTTIGGVLSGTGNLIKNGTGNLTLSGGSPNTFSGDTTVNAGTLVLSKSDGINAIADGGTTRITVNSGGTLLWGANNQLANGVDVTLNGGTINMANHSEGTASAAGLGALTLAANSTIDLGGASTSILHFDTTSSIAWTSGTILTVQNWSGSLSGGASEGLYFGVGGTGLTASQVGQIRFVNPVGFAPGTYPGRILPSGEVVPVPEPATYVAMGILALLVGWRERRRLAGWLKAMRSAV
jgi:autotransporter-associated beta strand protein